MPLYQYRARDKDGALHTGTMEAARKEGVADQLSGMGHIPVMIEEQGQERSSGIDFGALFGKIKPQDLIIFSRQLATLMSAGIPFIQGLVTLERQSENPRLKAAISQIRREIEGGSSFSDALARQPKYSASFT
jgi:type IV pilus assembly protein PilC